MMSYPGKENIVKILIRIARQPDDTYTARCPELPGCVVRAKSRDEARNRIRDAVGGYVHSRGAVPPREFSHGHAV